MDQNNNEDVEEQLRVLLHEIQTGKRRFRQRYIVLERPPAPTSPGQENNSQLADATSEPLPKKIKVDTDNPKVEKVEEIVEQIVVKAETLSCTDAELEDTSTFAEYSDTSEVDMAATQVKIQKPAPFFKGTAVVDGEFKEISLEDYKGKYVVLFFYPLDFTFVCPTEIIAFSDHAAEFRKIGCELIAASTDSHFSHLAWINTPRKAGGLGKMEIPLLADKNGEIAKKYGIYKEEDGIAFRGLFIIDAEQKLRQITVNDLPVGRNVEETLRLVQAFQFTDKFGEVCPVGWKPGSKTIKPTVEDSKTFFINGNPA